MFSDFRNDAGRGYRSAICGTGTRAFPGDRYCVRYVLFYILLQFTVTLVKVLALL